MKYEIFGHLDIEDVIELDDNLTEKEVEEYLKEYIFGFLEWGYKKKSE